MGLTVPPTNDFSPQEPARLLLPAFPGAAAASEPYSHPWLREKSQNLGSMEQGMESRRSTAGHALAPAGLLAHCT